MELLNHRDSDRVVVGNKKYAVIYENKYLEDLREKDIRFVVIYVPVNVSEVKHFKTWTEILGYFGVVIPDYVIKIN